MKNLILILTLLVLSYSTYPQEIKTSWITGDWRVEKATHRSSQLDEEQKQMMQMVLNGFTNSIFSFKASGQFNLRFNDQLKGMMKELYFLENAKWKTNKELTEIQIGTKEDNFSLMGLDVKKEGNTVFFLIQESTIKLEMKKTQ